ncbi:AAA family ATPase [Tenacibaculum finnmarkense genomovar ulcerans]|uniref:AAA family ATPase n=1 Tax=Tenacibaculum finnmarkense TaxID=2781243 RepID=UPI001E2AF45C|nr:AAA family ATPase [Tenacibaculum finnmarkense]MCD8431045.1 AAA family ATPase [Tenacibaculum finnmarkense genomovar ulcerans]
MIKRIKQIKNIGTFSNFTASNLQFEKLTFIYGLNTYGKTTLTDIFQSIKNNDFSTLKLRKSIPQVPFGQQIEINYKLKTSNNEQTLKINNDSWVNNQISSNIEIFSSEFIHKNLFTGLSIERSNKENFTQFILGDTGVELAKQITEKKRLIKQLKKELPNKKPNFIKNANEQDLDDFINIDISSFDLENLKTEYSNKQLELNNEKERLKEPEKILAKPNPCQIDIPKYNLLEAIEKINELLNSNFEDISEEALKKVNNHIAINFKNTEIAENWIKTGKENIKDANCSFCGQELNNVSDLIASYNQFFNEEYNTYIKDIDRNYNNHIKTIDNSSFLLKDKFNQEILKTNEFNEIVNNPIIKQKITELNNQIALLNEEDLNTLILDSLKKIDKLYDEKKLKPHTSIISFDKTEIEEKLSKYIEISISINEKNQEIIALINTIKDRYQDIAKLKIELTKKEELLKNIEYKIKRIEQDVSCESYKDSVLNITNLQNEITSKEAELESNQTTYLQTYYSKINILFEQLGGENFTLEKKSSSRGLQPVYSLNVKFHDKEINEKDFAKIFSESDKRALALAVFWTKIELMTPEEKAKTILILDDPVTSFDDNRVSKSIDLFKDSMKQLNQVIILTHYSSFIKQFSEKTHNEPIKFLELKKILGTSKLQDFDLDKIIKSDYQRTFEKITGYIKREHENCIKDDLRKFLETCYIPHFYPHKIIQAKNENIDISKLGKKIDYIFSEDENRKNKFHSFRENTNPNAHIFTTNNSEDVKSFAKEMIKYMYPTYK